MRAWAYLGIPVSLDYQAVFLWDFRNDGVQLFIELFNFHVVMVRSWSIDLDDGHVVWSGRDADGDESAGDGHAGYDTAGDLLPDYKCHSVLVFLLISNDSGQIWPTPGGLASVRHGKYAN